LGLKSVDCSQDESKTHPISPTCCKDALKTFLLHVLFTRFFFNCQGVAKQQAEYAKIDEAESRRIEWIHRQEIKINQGTKTGGAGNRAIFVGSGEWFP